MKRLLVLVLVAMIALAFAQPVAAWGNVHIVRYGETLFSIGRLYGVNPYSIASANGIVNPNCIYAGQRLVIPSYGYYYYPYYGAHTYVVRYGDTLIRIAYRFGIDPWTLAYANGIYNLNRIYAGQVLRIP